MTILASLDFLTASLEGSCCLLPQHPGLLPQQLQGPQLPWQECTSARGGTAIMDLSACPLLQLFQPGTEWEATVPCWHGGIGEEQVVPSGVWVHIIPTPKEHLSGSTCTSPLTPVGMVSRWDGLGLRSRHSLAQVC